MIWAVSFILLTMALLGWGSSVVLWRRHYDLEYSGGQLLATICCFLAPPALSMAMWWKSMESGVRALERMDRTPG